MVSTTRKRRRSIKRVAKRTPKQIITEPYPFQAKGVRKIRHFRGRALVADELGLGKTLEALLYATEENLYPIVVVCPATIKWSWETEAKVHFGLRAEVLEGRSSEVLPRIFRPPLVVVNYEILKYKLPYLRSLKPKLVIIDEGHRIKNKNTQTTKFVNLLCKRVKQVLVLTGTPLTNRPVDLWPILSLLRPDIFKDFFSFGIRYCGAKRNRWGWEYKGATNLGELHRILNQVVMLRRLKSDVMKDLPKISRYVIPVELDNKDEYTKARDNYITWLKENQGLSKAKSANRAKRITQMGYLKRLAARLKIKSIFGWIDSFLEETDEKLVVFAIHKKIIRMLKNRYKGICVVVDGSVKGKNRRHMVETFKTKKKIRLFFGNIKAAGIGMNGLQEATSKGLVIELEWDPASHNQLEARLHRIKQKSAVQWYYLIARGTIEDYLCQILQEKQKVFSSTIDGEPQPTDFDLFDRLEDLIIRSAKKETQNEHLRKGKVEKRRRV